MTFTFPKHSEDGALHARIAALEAEADERPSAGDYVELKESYDRLKSAAATAYGLLWQMRVDKSTQDGRLKSQARAALRDVLTVQEQGDGIARALALKTPNVM